MDQRDLTLVPPVLAEDHLGFFRWGHIAGKVLVSNDAGDWLFLTEQEFNDLLAGRIVDGHQHFEELQRKGFLREGMDIDALVARVARRNRHVSRGPHLHVVTLTARCVQRCTYCGPIGQVIENIDADMSPETAEKVVDLAMQSSSPSIAIEFQGQGGEPLLNFDVLRHLVEVACSRGKRAGKTLSFSLISNFTQMTEERAEWLIHNDVRISTSLDGPASVHDANLKWKHGGLHAEVVRWIEYFTRRYTELGRDPKLWYVDALLTTTRNTLGVWREVVDEYVTRGIRSIHLRPLNPSGLPRDVWSVVGYTAEEYIGFYRLALDYILELNGQGVEIIERMASIFLIKILTADDPGVIDIQSPCGDGTAQIVYHSDGRVFPCDEARKVDGMGDPIFELGNVRDLTIAEILRHPTVRAIAAASLLDAQPMCADCWNKPFCGVSPVYNFVTQQSLFGQRPRSFKCKEHMAVSGRIFELLSNENNSGTVEILKRWTTTSSRIASDARVSKDAP